MTENVESFLLPVLCTAAAFATGWFLIDFLTREPRRIVLYLSLVFVSLAALGVSVYLLDRYTSVWIGVALAVAGITAGYLIHAGIFLNQDDPREIPEITRRQSNVDGGHLAVVYFTHGEPETYNPIGWINQFKEFDEQNIQFVPFVARPFFVYALRNKYLDVGKSTHVQVHRTMIDSLEQLYRLNGNSTTRFYLSFLDAEPRPDAAVIRALNDGAGKIIIANVFLTVSNHTAEGQSLINDLSVSSKYGVELVFTEPMWSSSILKEAFIEKAHAALGDTPKEKTAVAFVGHGQPDEWDIEWQTETAQEEGFRQDLMDSFVANGFKRENLGSAWMEFKNPKPAALMDRFIQNGVEKVLYFSTAISAEAIHSEVDVPRLVGEYTFPEYVTVINLGAWNNHPTVVRAIKTRIDEYIDS